MNEDFQKVQLKKSDHSHLILNENEFQILEEYMIKELERIEEISSNAKVLKVAYKEFYVLNVMNNINISYKQIQHFNYYPNNKNFEFVRYNKKKKSVFKRFLVYQQ